ncbi:MAG: Maf family protein [Candidatus Cloacimonas sp.]|jgi:septum formation protein|nr:Maf family protein [Candidatus Cloacimonas sp.]
MIHKLLANTKVILASASPRRRELFTLLGLSPQITPADLPEPLTAEAPEIQAMHHAKNKALHIRGIVAADALIVAADTLVAVNEQILGKPDDEPQAKAFLQLLSGQKHNVYTGICIIYNGAVLCDYECTAVSFAQLSHFEIDAYIATKEPMDKAGAYGIQGFGAQFITRVEGCYFNVMGFPIRKFYEMLKELLAKEML